MSQPSPRNAVTDLLFEGEPQESEHWPEVSNPLARTVLREAWEAATLIHSRRPWEHSDFQREAWEAAPKGPVARPWEYLDMTLPVELFVYRNELRERLAESGIAQRLPAGLDAFPDIFEKMAWLPRQLGRLVQPRNYGRLTRHLLRHLEWYLEPRLSPPDASVAPAWMICAGLLLGPALAIAGLNIYSHPLALVLKILGLLIFTAAAYTGRSVEFFNLGQDSQRLHYSIQAAEFYYYLRECYCDSDGGGAPGGLLPTAELKDELAAVRRQRQTARVD